MFDLKEISFFHNVDADDIENREEGRAGARTLGDRNRWAVICMDGNDMGSQLRYITDVIKPAAQDMVEWVEQMSESLDRCAHNAAKAGIKKAVEEWKEQNETEEIDGTVILPVRPIVVGGDDIILLCHVSYAMSFVKEAIRVFNTTSREEAELWRESESYKKNRIELWPATGGNLTISAGVLFCPVSLPLHTAIGYAESLLASAKSRGRKALEEEEESSDIPTPASIDWEQITDSVIDTPSARRQREMIFIDGDINCDNAGKSNNSDSTIENRERDAAGEEKKSGRKVKLTSRPCTLKEFEEIEKLASYYKSYPATIRHKVLPAMRKGFCDRLAFVAEIAKNQRELAGHLSEKYFAVNEIKSEWKYYDENSQVIHNNIEEEEFKKRVRCQKTQVIDALLLLEEANRMEKKSVDEKQESLGDWQKIKSLLLY